MTSRECGPALLLVYGNDRLEVVLIHEHDGGEAYMGPLLRKAVAYARTHYESGNIVDVLEAEQEMRKASDSPFALASAGAVRHVYYVKYRWDERAGKKSYTVDALHLGGQSSVDIDLFPEDGRKTPENLKRIV